MHTSLVKAIQLNIIGEIERWPNNAKGKHKYLLQKAELLKYLKEKLISVGVITENENVSKSENAKCFYTIRQESEVNSNETTKLHQD
jgi:hypothetical protein